MGAFIRLAAEVMLALALMQATAAPLAAQGAHRGEATKERRAALVIGNGRYRHVPVLKNPGNDAADIAAALERIGFEVTPANDLDKAAMDQAVRAFAGRLSGAALGLFFFAGHGLQHNGRNYLVPVDAEVRSSGTLEVETVALDTIQSVMESATRTSLIFLDACRNNPLTRNLAGGGRSIDGERGLAPVQAGAGTLISFATKPGAIASDGEGRNSPYTAALVRHLSEPGEDLMGVLVAVRNSVMAATGERQVPWEHSALRRRVHLGGGRDAGTGTEAARPKGASPALGRPQAPAPGAAGQAAPPPATAGEGRQCFATARGEGGSGAGRGATRAEAEAEAVRACTATGGKACQPITNHCR